MKEIEEQKEEEEEKNMKWVHTQNDFTYANVCRTLDLMAFRSISFSLCLYYYYI